MTVEAPVRAQAARSPRGDRPPLRRRARPLLRWLAGVGIALAAVVCAALVAIWPVLTLLLLGTLVVISLALREPPLAVVAAVLLFGLEGVIKVGLVREISGAGVAPEAVGAAVIDLCLLVAVLGVLRRDRGRTLLSIWGNGGRWTRAGLALLAAWLVLSLFQIALTNDLGAALAGLRLTQAYVLALVAGALLLAARRPERVLAALLAALLVIAAYAAFRGVAGPSEGERLAAFSRSTTPLVPIEDGVIFRNVGSFSSAIGLASFLAPTAVFLFTLGLGRNVRMRLAAWMGVALVCLALVGTYVRASLIATSVGVACAAALLAVASDLARRTKLALALASVPIVIVLLALGTLAETSLSGDSEQLQQRSAGVLNPLSDPSVNTRLQRWSDALDTVRAHPLGTGVGTVGAATVDAEGAATFVDNSYLKILHEQGPLGAAAFIFGILAVMVGAARGVVRRSIQRRALGVAALSAATAFFVLALASEAIEQPGKVLVWLFLGIALWAAFGGAPGDRALDGPQSGVSGRSAGELVGRLAPWARWRYAPIVVLLAVVPVAVSLLRAPHFESTLEVLPTRPAGNAGVSSAHGRALAGVVRNSGFQAGAQGWGGAAGFALRHATDKSHSGTASLASVSDGRGSAGATAASTQVVLPAPGRYRVQASVHVPHGYSGGPPRIALEGFAGAARVGVQAGDLRARGRWQTISSDYVVDARDLHGTIALRVDSPVPAEGQVLHWDDVHVLSSGATPARTRTNLVSNAGFEYDTSGWGDPPSFVMLRSERLAHGGSASLRTIGEQRAPADTNAAYTHLVFPRAGTYRADAWAYLPRRARGARPGVFLEGFSGARQLAQRLGDPALRDSWQPVSVTFAISSTDLEGSLVLRNLPDGDPADGRAALVYWDDVSVPASKPAPPRDASKLAAGVRAALDEPQLRFEVASLADDVDLYDPGRATVVPSSRAGMLSFTVRVAHDVPSDARKLTRPLRIALARAARRGALRRSQRELQEVVSRLAPGLSERQRDLLQRRANVLQRVIGAQAADAVVLPAAAPPPSATALRAHQQVERDRQKVIARLGAGLPPRQRALVQQLADDLQRRVASQAAEYVVLPSGRVAGPTRPVDRLLDRQPGPFPPRVDPGWAAAAGLLAALLLLAILPVASAARRPAAAPTP